MANETSLPSQYDTDAGYSYMTYGPTFIAEQQLDEAADQVQAKTDPGQSQKQQEDDIPISPHIRPNPDHRDKQPPPYYGSRPKSPIRPNVKYIHKQGTRYESRYQSSVQPNAIYIPDQRHCYGSRPRYYGTPDNVRVLRNQPISSIERVREKPNSGGALAIFTCLCCCWPMALVALVCSNQSSKAWEEKNYARARWCSCASFMFSMASIAFTAGVILYIILYRNFR